MDIFEENMKKKCNKCNLIKDINGFYKHTCISCNSGRNRRMTYLLTGGTGFLGRAMVEYLLKNENIKEIRIFSRDEYKQSKMAGELNDGRIKYWLGDICDLERLREACKGVDILIHAAAAKRMDNSSHNTYYVAKVNIEGTQNVALAGIRCKNIVLISTDKAYQPSCVYGCSKFIAESIILATPHGSVCRFGNFINSRGSVFEIFKEQKEKGIPLTITDPNATRFVIDIKDVCKFIMTHLSPGLHYPKNLKAMTIKQIADEIAPGHPFIVTGLREGEKMDESFNEDYTSKKCL